MALLCLHPPLLKLIFRLHPFSLMKAPTRPHISPLLVPLPAVLVLMKVLDLEQLQPRDQRSAFRLSVRIYLHLRVIFKQQRLHCLGNLRLLQDQGHLAGSHP